MADDMTDKLKAVLNNPEMMGMLSSFLGSEKNDTVVDADNDNTESLVSVKNMMEKINGNSDKRITLLNALKPYMRNSRASNIDKAIKMLKITKFSSIFKDL